MVMADGHGKCKHIDHVGRQREAAVMGQAMFSRFDVPVSFRTEWTPIHVRHFCARQPNLGSTYGGVDLVTAGTKNLGGMDGARAFA